MAKLISALELVRKFRISYQTLNHYINLGLIDNTARRGFKRFYNEKEVRRRLIRIKELQNKGYTLKLISEVIKS